MIDNHEDLIQGEEVARICGVRESTATQWRHLGRGPTFSRVSPIQYRRADVEQWLAAQATPPSWGGSRR